VDAIGSVSKSSNESGASDSSIVDGVVPVASAAKDSAVVEGAATRAVKAAIGPMLPAPMLEAEAPAGDVGSATAADADAGAAAQRPDVDEAVVFDDGAEALGRDAAAEGASAINVGAEVDQRPDVDADVLDDAGGAAGVVEAEPVVFADGTPAIGVGAAADDRAPEAAAADAGADAEEALADEVPGRVGRGGRFAAGGGDAAGAGRAGGTGGIADFEIGLPTAAARGPAPGPAADGVAGRLAPGELAVAPEGCCAAAKCEEDGGD